MTNHVVDVKSCHSCQIVLFCQIKSFVSNHVIHVKSCHSCQIMSFMSNHVILVKSCHSYQIMSIMSVIWAFTGQAFTKVGRGSQICLPMPSATASLSGRRQKRSIAWPRLIRPCEQQQIYIHVYFWMFVWELLFDIRAKIWLVKTWSEFGIFVWNIRVP
jgi:hypothetical protein